MTPGAVMGVGAATPSGQPVMLVTRPDQDAQHWVRHLVEAGVQAEALPLIEIGPASAASDVLALQQAWQTLDHYAACLFVSGNAVDYFFKKMGSLAGVSRPSLAIKNIAKQECDPVPAQLRLMAPGPGTAAALVAHGVVLTQIDMPPADAGQFDSQNLWKVVGQRDWRGRRVLIVRGCTPATQPTASAGQPSASGRDWITRQWEAAGAKVECVTVYERRAPQLTAWQLERARSASHDGTFWLFSSSEAVANLICQSSLSAMDWSRARAVATHPRIASSLREAGWGVVVASRPTLVDIVASLRSIESGHP